MNLVNRTEGDILELGSGIFSTPYLHWACYANKRKLVTYDNSPEYIGLMQQYANDYHQVISLDDFADADIEKFWSIAFVDHDPAFRRGVEAGRLANYAQFVVLHDSDPRNDASYNYPEIYPLYKYRWDFTEVRPNTTILSNFVNLEDFKL
jgi:hypothetical protein